MNFAYGRYFTRLLAVEFEGGYLVLDPDFPSSDLYQIPLLVNARVNLPILFFEVYGGGGIGGMYYNLDIDPFIDSDGWLFTGDLFLGADIALHFALLYPQRVDKIVVAEAGTAALVHLRQQADWPGWAGWARALEKYGGIKAPPEKWHDVDYMLRQSLTLPVVFGPARGLPRKGARILELLDTTTLVQDYQDTAGMTLEALTQVTHPVLLIYGSESTYMGTYDALKETLPNCVPVLVPGCEHFGILEKPELLNQYAQEFMQTDRSPVRVGSA